jgi:hypothetical protein
MTDDKNRSVNAWKRGTQEVEEFFARFESMEGKRRNLIESIKAEPDNPIHRETLRGLSDKSQIRRAAASGIFISYARPDEIFALDISMILLDAGLPVWLDVVHGGNQDWSDEIDQALKRCGLMVAVVSPDTMNDAMTLSERQQFVERGKLVLPVFRQTCQIDPALLWLDPIDFSQNFEQAIDHIRELLVEEEARA